jgi:hypothetical protein
MSKKQKETKEMESEYEKFLKGRNFNKFYKDGVLIDDFTQRRIFSAYLRKKDKEGKDYTFEDFLNFIDESVDEFD